MTQEDKQLLLKDLCARLPYGVKFKYGDYDGCDYKLEIISSVSINNSFPIDDCKPYLRPMDSMTEEEQEEFRTLIFSEASCAYEDCLEWDTQIIGGGYLQISVEDFSNVIDWLNDHRFDYRGLIEKSLAIVAPENMYK